MSLSTIKERTELAGAFCLVGLVFAAGCGGGSSAAPLEKTLSSQRNAQEVRCSETGRLTYQGKRVPLYRCKFVEEVSVNAMGAEKGCFVYVKGAAVQVGARC
jgi:hypothetical protein